jgi:serine/threonine-protein kinase
MLSSPHTIDLYDFGLAEDGALYYVMELLHGVDLQTLVEKYGPAPAERAAHFIGQVCSSLEEAHQSGLVHRDIKPANIYTCRCGLEYDFTKVLDFGIVKSREELNGLTKLTNADGLTEPLDSSRLK